MLLSRLKQLIAKRSAPKFYPGVQRKFRSQVPCRFDRHLLRHLPLFACTALATAATLGIDSWSNSARAEGSHQMGLNQWLFEYNASNSFITAPAQRPIMVNILNPGEVINISLCGQRDSEDLRIQIYDPSGTQVLNQFLGSSNVSCTHDFDIPLTNPVRYDTTPTGTGTYEVRLYNESQSATSTNNVFERYDITVTPNVSTNPDPTENQGRVWATSWAFNGGSTFSVTGATDADLFIRVPGGRIGTEFIWILDLNRFAPQRYEIIANNIGVDAPNSGYSTPVNGNDITRQYPIYLSYPDGPILPEDIPPDLSNVRFVDSQGIDATISPGGSIGVQDTGFFEFTTSVTGNYAITIDTNQDGIYGTGDRLLLGTVTPGSNSVEWDGRDIDDNILPAAIYNARLEVRIGEYHFVAGDAETSGGGTDNGLTIHRTTSPTTFAPTQVFWDDVTQLPGAGGTSNLPNGGASNTPAGRHTWGNFRSSGFGDKKYIDTYTFAESVAYTLTAIVADNDNPVVSAPDVVLVKRITAINGNRIENTNDAPPTSLNNVINDGVANSADDASNWPAGYLVGELNAGLVKPGDEIEYTVYFLNASSGAAENVRICDWIQPNQSVVTGLYGGNDIELDIGGTTYQLTATNDTADRAEITTVGSLPASPDCNLSGTADTNDSVLVIDITGTSGDPTGLTTLPGTTGQGAPNNAYGFFRFTTKVDE